MEPPWHRAAWLVLAFLALAAVFSLPAVHGRFEGILVAAQPTIADHPLGGGVLFVVLAAGSAVLMFFSSVLLVPAAVLAWGPATTAALLWLGWWLGGACTYVLGRILRRPLLLAPSAARLLDRYARHVPGSADWWLIVLLQLALPSEIPGYLCGLLQVRARLYLSALAVAELPYAAGTVLLGDSLVAGRLGWFLVVGVLAAAGLATAMWLLHRRLHHGEDGP